MTTTWIDPKIDPKPNGKTQTTDAPTKLRDSGARKPRHVPFRSALGRSFGKWLALGSIGLLLLIAGGPILSMLANRFNPLATKTIDHSGPVLLTAIHDMHTYQAATGQFQVVVDIEKDAKWLPSAVRGERVVLMAQGSVDAGVDLGSVGPRSISIDPVTKDVTIIIPHAKLGDAHVDLGASKIVRHDRGLLDRIGSTFGDAPQTDNNAYALAETKLYNAAITSTLRTKAEQNTEAMLRQLVGGLGHSKVTVHFSDVPLLAGPPNPAPTPPAASSSNY